MRQDKRMEDKCKVASKNSANESSSKLVASQLLCFLCLTSLLWIRDDQMTLRDCEKADFMDDLMFTLKVYIKLDNKG